MAKQLVNPIERHLEKAVVAVAALLLLGAAAKYLLSSPNQLELAGTTVTPGGIDAAVAQAAAAARERIRSAPADEPSAEPLLDDFVALLDPYRAASLPTVYPRVVPVGPEVPTIDPPEDVGVVSQLPAVVPFKAVGMTHGRTTFRLDTATGIRHLATNWVTVAGLFDVKAQTNELIQKYGVLNKDVIFGMPELQRRQPRPDGSWSDEDWKTITPWRPTDRSAFPDPPAIALVDEGDGLVVPRPSKLELDKYIELVRSPAFQRDILRPITPQRVNGDEWNFPLLTDRRDVLMQDDYFLFPDKPPAPEPMDIYRPAVTTEPTVKTQLSPAEQIEAMFKEAAALMQNAKANRVKNDAVRAYNILFEIENHAQAGASDKNKARKLKQDADVLANDLRREELRTGGALAQPGQSDEHTKREPPNIQQLWVHDAAEGSVEGGRTYQYRLRPTILNTLAGQPEKFSKPADATTVWLPGTWCEPVTVTVEEHLRFFLTGDDKRDLAVNVEFYRWFNGAWVKSRRVEFATGNPVETSQITDVPSDIDPTVATRATVEFATGLNVVDVDFNRSLRERRRGDSRTGVKFGDPRNETAVVLVDEEGRLVERFVATDKANEERKELNSRLFAPPKTP